MPEAVIVATARSPIGRAGKGSLTSIRPDDLAVQIVRAALAKVPQLDPAAAGDLMLGCGLPGGEQGFNMARVVAVLLGHDHLPGTTVNRYCSSSLQTTRMAFHAIKAGEGDAYIAVGVEWVSRFNEASEPVRVDDRDQNLIGENGQPNAYIDMGLTAVNVANKYGVSREDMDKFAQRSQELAVKSQEDGFFDREIVPVDVNGTLVTKDDGPRASSTLEKLSELDEAFGGGGVTAGNSCPLNDGAAAVLLMSDTKAKELGLTPRARIVTAATYGNEPELMGVAPIGAIKKVLDRAGMTIDNIDAVELNEAFAAQVIPIMSECGIAEDKLNTHGGAIALGHPFGMTGARIMGTLLNVLETDDKQVGIETMCVAGGQGKAMVVERV